MKKIAILSLFISISPALIGQKNPFNLPFNPALKPFYHGVASGDPLEDRVIRVHDFHTLSQSCN